MSYRISLISLLLICTFFQSWSQNREKLDSLWGVVEIAQHDTTRISTFLNIGDVYESVIPDSALFYYQKVIDLADRSLRSTPPKQTNDKINALKAISLRYIGIVYDDQGNYDKAMEYCERAIINFEELLLNCTKTKTCQHANENRYRQGTSNCYTDMGNVYQKQGSYDIAIEYYLKAIIISEELDDKSGLSACYNNIGIVHMNRGNYDKAIESFLEALVIDEKTGDKMGMSKCYTNIGIINHNQKSYNKAIEYYQKSVEIKIEIGDKKGMSTCYIGIGGAYWKLGNDDKAVRYYQIALLIKEELGDKKGMSLKRVE